MPICFIISPIGESGSEIRRDADDLRDLLIKPVLSPFGFEVVRGDHRSDAGQIDSDVIRSVQEADLCIADISLPNANVYYEFGRRDETGKPLILLKSKGSGDLPVDVATRRYIEYDLDSRRGIIDAMESLRSNVLLILEKGFETTGNGSSLPELAEILKRVERKIDRIQTAEERPVVEFDGGNETSSNPVDLFKLAMQQRNIPLAENAMMRLKYSMELNRWLDQVVEQVAGLGSIKAGDILIKNAESFMDSGASFKEKIDYLSYLVSNLNRTYRGVNNIEFVEKLAEMLLAVCSGEPVDLCIIPYNQLNRLYYGIYGTTRDKKWLQKSIDALQKALKMTDNSSFLHYNLGICLRENGEEKAALKHIIKAVELDGERPDADHLETLCSLLHKLNDPRLMDYLIELERVDKVKAQLLRNSFKM